jgi:hypothetical protein
LLALGSKESSGHGFDDTGGNLSIHHVPFSETGYTAPQVMTSRDIPVQNIQSVRICQYKIFCQ